MSNNQMFRIASALRQKRGIWRLERALLIVERRADQSTLEAGTIWIILYDISRPASLRSEYDPSAIARKRWIVGPQSA